MTTSTSTGARLPGRVGAAAPVEGAVLVGVSCAWVTNGSPWDLGFNAIRRSRPYATFE
ncbi:hypothetical protein Aglo03_44190 [Actinokineospora globicatena]|uniref:Uncharacterized protein n=1 Tax=Actinokineospora globicatena TaxID=103729 RepID=A0A9W6VC37_9PSEU|nr:hypothetical protein Aglo03_44190 [Actinokineospora globicatena]